MGELLNQPEPGHKAEIEKPVVARETIPLPLEEGEWVHLEADRETMANGFGDYAEHLGFDRDRAVAFYRNNVDFRFGDADHTDVAKKPIDKVVPMLLKKTSGHRGLGRASYKEDRVDLVVDINNIARFLGKESKIVTDEFTIEGYTEMTAEERQMAIKQFVKTVLEHEFYHIIQMMDDPEGRREIDREVGRLYRTILGGFTVMTASVAIPDPDVRFPLIMATGAAVLAYTACKTRGTKGLEARLEDDAYATQKQALSWQLESPLKISFESDPIN